MPDGLITPRIGVGLPREPSRSPLPECPALPGSRRFSRLVHRRYVRSPLVRPLLRRPSSRSSRRTQFMIVCAVGSTPSTTPPDLDPDQTSATIFSRNSHAYGCRVFAIGTPPPQKDRVSTKAGQLKARNSARHARRVCGGTEFRQGSYGSPLIHDVYREVPERPFPIVRIIGRLAVGVLTILLFLVWGSDSIAMDIKGYFAIGTVLAWFCWLSFSSDPLRFRNTQVDNNGDPARLGSLRSGMLYSMDRAVPLLGFDSEHIRWFEDECRLNDTPSVCVYFYLHSILGFALISLLIASLTGVLG